MFMTVKKTILCLLAIGLTSPVLAQEAEVNVRNQMYATGRVLGAGADLCSVWTDKRAAGSGWFEHAQWLNGFLTSQSMLLFYSEKLDLLSNQKIDGYNMLPTIDAFCKSNPQANLVSAGQELFGAAYKAAHDEMDAQKGKAGKPANRKPPQK